MPLRLDGHGSLFVVFRQPALPSAIVSIEGGGEQIFPMPKHAGKTRRPFEKTKEGLVFTSPGSYSMKTHNGHEKRIRQGRGIESLDMTGPWEVRFPFGWDAPGRTQFPELISWTESPDTGIKYFSGTAVYHKSLVIEEQWLSKNRRILLDLGRVEKVADVFINGHHAGILWHSPYRVEVTDFVRSGKNNLVIEITNVLNNRLVGDARRPPQLRRTHTNVDKGPNAWTTPWQDVPLKTSGLLGPVRLIVEDVHPI